MMDDQNAQAPAVQTDEQQSAPAASPAATPERVEQEQKDGDEKATA